MDQELQISQRNQLNDLSSGKVNNQLKDDYQRQSSDFNISPDEGEEDQIEEQKQKLIDPIQIQSPTRKRLSTQQLIFKINKVTSLVEIKPQVPQSKSNFLKRMVSKEKNRYEADGFDLDLTYITSNIIAMGFPAIDYESVYRNSMKDVQRFFNQRHPNNYKIYNLCEERKYPHSMFNGSVEEFPFFDHQAPPFELIIRFVESVDKYLKQDSKNVAGIHCKAGKGRTGLMVCCYLLYSKFLVTSYDVQRYYALVRTKNRKGIVIASQIRYLDYFEEFLQSNLSLKTIAFHDLAISQMNLVTIPNFKTLGGCDPWFRIQNGSIDYISQHFGTQKGKGTFKMAPENVFVRGDVLIQMFNNSFKNSHEKMFQLWLNTAFINPGDILFFRKEDLDVAQKDKTDKKFGKDFRFEISFHQAPQIRRRSHLRPDLDVSPRNSANSVSEINNEFDFSQQLDRERADSSVTYIDSNSPLKSIQITSRVNLVNESDGLQLPYQILQTQTAEKYFREDAIIQNGEKKSN